MSSPTVIVRLTRALLAAIILVACFAARAAAQYTTGAISGVVEDPSGATVPGATITLKNLGTNETVIVTSSADGGYSFAALLPAAYSITARYPGFKTIEVRTNEIGMEAWF